MHIIGEFCLSSESKKKLAGPIRADSGIKPSSVPCIYIYIHIHIHTYIHTQHARGAHTQRKRTHTSTHTHTPTQYK